MYITLFFLSRWITSNIESFCKALVKDEPMFSIEALLAPPDILMRPSPHIMLNTIIHSVKDFLDRLKSFKRWMDGTCLLCEPVLCGDSHYIFSYFEDVMQVDWLIISHLE